MHLVTAIIKPHRLEDVTNALKDIDVNGMTISEVQGFGRQRGHTEVYRGSEYKVDFVPKSRSTCCATTPTPTRSPTSIAEAARTGKIGDGKIWITEVSRIVRIRTGETDRRALSTAGVDESQQNRGGPALAPVPLVNSLRPVTRAGRLDLGEVALTAHRVDAQADRRDAAAQHLDAARRRRGRCGVPSGQPELFEPRPREHPSRPARRTPRSSRASIGDSATHCVPRHNTPWSPRIGRVDARPGCAARRCAPARRVRRRAARTQSHNAVGRASGGSASGATSNNRGVPMRASSAAR